MLRQVMYPSLLFVLVFVLYLPGLNGPWLLDDQPNIVLNKKLQNAHLDPKTVKEAITSMPGDTPLGVNRPLSFFSLHLDYVLASRSGPDANSDTLLDLYKKQIKTTNVLIHLVCGWLILALTRQLLTQITHQPHNLPNWFLPGLSLATTALWLMHPMQVSTVLYSVQRMTLLSALFTLAGLNLFFYFREQMRTTGQGFYPGVISVGLATLLATLSKENGALLPLFCLLSELTFFRLQFGPQTSVARKMAYLIALTAPCLALVSYLLTQFIQLDAQQVYWSRGYTPSERLVTEMDVIIRYVVWFFLPLPDWLTFYHDWQPIRHWPSLFAGLLLVGFASAIGACIYCLVYRIARIPAFGLLFFLTGHLIESTVIPLELVFEHRNYVPYFGLALALVWTISRIPWARKSSKRFSYLLLIVCLVAPLLLTIQRVQHWQSEAQLLAHWHQVNGDAPRVWSQTAEYLYRQEGDISGALAALHKAFVLAPWEAGFGFAQLSLYCAHAPGMFRNPAENPRDLATITALQQQIIQALAMPPNTVYAVNQLGGMLMACHTAEQRRVLAPLLNDAPVVKLASRIRPAHTAQKYQ